jgi:hypothetical protein
MSDTATAPVIGYNIGILRLVGRINERSGDIGLTEVKAALVNMQNFGHDVYAAPGVVRQDAANTVLHLLTGR